ncbi:MAG: 6-pyruvoyl-tetrahydropterin synthase-related protein [Pyrinomonadaceae bacterium]
MSSQRPLGEALESTIPYHRWLPISLVVLAGALALLPAVIFGIPTNNDLPNHYHFALPFYESIAGGDFYPGWLASSNQGYGDPLFRFYPPGLYYLLALTRSLTGEWYTASLTVFTLLSILGSLGAYFWASSFLPRNIALWAGIFYAFMPYHVAEIYQAAQIAEFAAGAALLFALGFTKRVCQHRRWRDVAGLAASYGMLILTHLPLAVFGSIAILAYALLSITANSKRETLLKLASAGGLGLAITSFYWTTVVAEMKWIVGDGSQPNPLLDYRANFIFSTFSPEKNVTIWWMNILTIVTLVMCLPAVALLSKRLLRSGRRDVGSVAVLMIVSLVMATGLSKPVWAAIPYLQMAQHPFRWLAVMSTVVPILMAATMPLWLKTFRGQKRFIALAMAGLVLISVTFTASQVIRAARYLSRSEFEQIIRPLNESPSIVQWLPVWASAASQGKPSYEKIPPLRNSAQVEAGQRSVGVVSWQALKRTFQVDPGEEIEARIRTLYFPHWVAVGNGQALATRPAADGALLVSLPAEAVTVSLEFREPGRTRVFAVISAICWTLLCLLLIFGSFNRMRREH